MVDREALNEVLVHAAGHRRTNDYRAGTPKGATLREPRQYEKRAISDVKSSSESARAAPSDEALLRRVQQQNQRQILGKLLHDLRNPIHSIRITLELFGRLARRNGDPDKLVERAAAYIEPAEAALNNLLLTNERLSLYLSGPAAPVMASLPIHEWLAEISLLLRASARQLRVEVSPAQPSQVWLVRLDRPRASHALLQYCLSRDSSQVSFAARADEGEFIHIDVGFAAVDPSRDQPVGGNGNFAEPQLTMEELRVLIENAGGTVAPGAGADISLRFQRSAEVSPPAR
jgi:hypothetical protein